MAKPNDLLMYVSKRFACSVRDSFGRVEEALVLLYSVKQIEERLLSSSQPFGAGNTTMDR